mgnify:CR=1 FL=1
MRVPHASNWCRAGSEVRIFSALDKPVLPLSSSLGLDRCQAHIGGVRSRRMAARMVRPCQLVLRENKDSLTEPPE